MIEMELEKFEENPEIQNGAKIAIPEQPRVVRRDSKVSKFFSGLCSCFYKKKIENLEETTLLPPEKNSSKKTLVLDLDETLVHSSLNPLPTYDWKLNIQVSDKDLEIYLVVRPWAFEFLEKASEMYEIVIFTASLKAYADPVIELIDRSKVVSSRLFRNECLNYNGSYVKNLSLLGRDLKKVVIVDNSPVSYAFHPYNAIAISSWFGDSSDRKLEEVFNILSTLNTVESIPKVLKKLGSQQLELSPKNISMIMDSDTQGRSTLNSPKPVEQSKFDFKEVLQV